MIDRFQKTHDKSILPEIAQNTYFFGKLEDESYDIDEGDIDIIGECFGQNSKEFIEFIESVDLEILVDNLNSLEYANEENLYLELDEVIEEQQEKELRLQAQKRNNNTQQSLEENTSDITMSEIEKMGNIIRRPLRKKEIGRNGE